MADAAQMFTGLNSHYLIFIFGIAIAVATIQFRYHQIATVLKWLALVLHYRAHRRAKLGICFA